MAEITEIREKLIGINSPMNIQDKMGETVYDFIQEDSNFTYDIGKSVVNVITDCETQQELDMADKMLTAICGYNLDSVMAKIEERDKSGYAWESLA